jgi:hypothetical protein
MDEGMLVDVVHCGHDALLELVFGSDADVAQDGASELGEEALDEVEPRSMLGRKGELEAAWRLFGELSLGFLGDVGGMIVEDQLDRRVGWIGLIEKLEELDELTAAVTILDQGVNLAGEKIDAGQQADRAVTLVFMIAVEGRVYARFGRQVRGRRGDRLDTGLFVIGDDGHGIARLGLRFGGALLEDLDLAIDAQDFRHLLLELWIASLKVVAHLVRLDLLLVEDLGHRPIGQLGETGVSLCRRMFAGVAGQKPHRPQFVRIAQLLRLPASQRYQPRLGFRRDRRLLARALAIIERCYRPIGQGSLDAALDRLVMHTQGLANRKEGRVFPVGKQHPRPFDPARRFATRPRHRRQPRNVLISKRQLNRTPPCRHDLRSHFSNQKPNLQPITPHVNPTK